MWVRRPVNGLMLGAILNFKGQQNSWPQSHKESMGLYGQENLWEWQLSVQAQKQTEKNIIGCKAQYT